MSEVLKQYKRFLAAIAKNPYDWATRRVFADFLEENGEDDEALEHRNWTRQKQEAEDNLRDMARGLGMSFEELKAEGEKIATTGEFCFGSDDAPSYMRSNWEEFLDSWRAYTGSQAEFKDRGSTLFSCGC